MNASVKSIVLASVLAGFGATAQAAIVLQDDFSYANGNLVGQTPDVGGAWGSHSGAGSVPVQVAAGAVVLNQGSGSREDVNATFTTPVGSGMKYYAGFDLTMSGPASSVTSTYFAHFLTGTSSFGSRVWVTVPSTAGYKLALSGGSSIESTWASDLAYGTTYRIVVAYDYDTGATTGGTLWVNPTSSASSSIATTTGFQNAFTSFAFRQASGNTIQTIDNLIVANTFDEAAGITVAPEPASLSLLALGGLLMLKRRRQA